MAADYSMPVRINFGEGIRRILPDLECVRSAKRISVFTGSSSLRKSGRLQEILGMLSGKDVTLNEGVSAEPTLVDLDRFINSERGKINDCIVVIGGGSAIDMAKSVALFAPQAGSGRSLLKKMPEKPKPQIPTVVLPTTAGTGSEVSPFAVLWDKEAMKKHSAMHPGLFPTEALVDPELTYSMPPPVTASTGMDAFTQATEAYWNRNHQPITDDYALDAVRRILPALPKAVQNGEDKHARYDMLLGSLQAGLAYSNTRTAACHSISYPMTLHFGVPHGQAVGVTLPAVLMLNAQAMPERADRFFRALDTDSMQEAVQKIRHMMEISGLKTRLSDLGIDANGVDLIVKDGFTPERMGNNPYIFDADSLKKILLSIL
ncbi:hypothetical protein A3A67_01325 [Candidatus Peribacteria bacterium RIFCSPLOWO2_01_FULL_51_18]|nr:MAG: hypothetical protein A3C52_00030 [Candidatus Peribacteria bacterium RIFCSPHIGHO2_02_FULL_51_15]OGJ65485.1 MAG: hypothetical protein A3A67_01325 [Candidatus Peribacteria bacterium RIFCSPLOWO2_01_FULL_51_18]OGJ67597.1 MAG: hypothetical protein A3J34_00730 [Candidatus Peribacteria bacterium RIFCSPLOWO2_02_FULL_51_10]